MLSALNRWIQANVLGIRHRPHCDILVNVGGNTRKPPATVSGAHHAKQRLKTEILSNRIKTGEKVPQEVLKNPVIMPAPIPRSSIRSNRLLSVSQEQRLMAQAKRIRHNTAHLPLSRRLSLTLQYSGSSRRFGQAQWQLNNVGMGTPNHGLTATGFPFLPMIKKQAREEIPFDFANIRTKHEVFQIVYENNHLCRFDGYPLDEQKLQEILDSPNPDLFLPIYADVRDNSLYFDTDSDTFFPSVQHNQAGLVACAYISKEDAYRYTGSKRLTEKQKQKILADMRAWIVSLPYTH